MGHSASSGNSRPRCRLPGLREISDSYYGSYTVQLLIKRLDTQRLESSFSSSDFQHDPESVSESVGRLPSRHWDDESVLIISMEYSTIGHPISSTFHSCLSCLQKSNWPNLSFPGAFWLPKHQVGFYLHGHFDLKTTAPLTSQTELLSLSTAPEVFCLYHTVHRFI